MPKSRIHPIGPACAAIVTVVTLTLAAAPDTRTRTWTDSTGRLQVEAEYLASQADKVWLRRVSDEQVFEVMLAELSQADRQYVAQLRQQQEAQRRAQPPDGIKRIAYGDPRQLAELANRAIDESSGLACSRRAAGLFWTHNDSGADARVFLFDTNGRDCGYFTLPGVLAYDWEDMASFTWQGKPYLLLCDTGNNGLAAPVQMLHLVEEPPVDAERGVTVRRVAVERTIYFSYEDDHRNCEAVAVDPADRTILLATKHFEMLSYVYALPWPEENPPGEQPSNERSSRLSPTQPSPQSDRNHEKALTARRIATLKIPMVTGMDISPDSRRAVLVTYGNAYEFARKEAESWAAAFAREPREVRLPLRIQGEAIAYGADGKTLYLTSEKLPTPFWEVPVAEATETRAPAAEASK